MRTIKTILVDAINDEKPNLDVDIVIEADKILINAKGYGDGCSVDGEGTPILIELADGKLRAVLWTDINEQDPKIVDMDGAKEDNRHPC